MELLRRPRVAALGTMHGKERAIAPALLEAGVELVVPPGLDTDRFGTFTGEVPRLGTMTDAARAKATEAAQRAGLALALASEGAYGPHPLVPWMGIGRELLLWLDLERGYEVVELLVDERPNFRSTEAASPGELEPFLAEVGFGATGVAVSPAEEPGRPVAKGVRTRGELAAAVEAARRQSAQGRALVVTDMRAHLNPRRMSVIGELARRLARRLATPCSACGAPGFGRLDVMPGLPCTWCGSPTELVRAELHGCTACGSREERPRSDGLAGADPGHCPRCNP